MTMYKRIIAFLLSGSPLLGFAHPGHGGHGDSGFTVKHYFVEPEHALMSLLTVSLLLIGYYVYKNRKRSNNA